MARLPGHVYGLRVSSASRRILVSTGDHDRRNVGKPERLPRTLSQRSANRLLEADGWTETLGGKHVVKMMKPGRRPITLLHHGGDDYSRDLSDRILRQAGLKGGDRHE
jgi:predicted RNA binding protein YcfA (HicA-like mRNA interferase family)